MNVLAGTYNYSISKPGYTSATGNVIVANQNEVVDVTLLALTTGINNSSENNITLYPNPFNDHITINSDTDIKTVIIRNASGVLFKTIQVKGNKTISTPSLPDGIYFITLEDVEGNISVFKKVKR